MYVCTYMYVCNVYVYINVYTSIFLYTVLRARLNVVSGKGTHVCMYVYVCIAQVTSVCFLTHLWSGYD